MPDLMERLKSALIDRYAVERAIGRGGMAAVYLAEDVKHDRMVAIKVLHPELAAAVGGDRFLREIQIAAKLEHPHILALIDSGEADGLPYYVMPYVQGESLKERMAREGMCFVFCPHTTAGLTLNENWDASVQHDLGVGLDAISPRRAEYRHGEGNSPAHIKSSLVGASQAVIIVEEKLVLGTWQGIYLAEFDGPRRRKVLVKVMASQDAN